MGEYYNIGYFTGGTKAMKLRLILTVTLVLGIILPAMAAAKTTKTPATITGQYMESRSADVYTGPCFANSEVNLTGHEAVLAWRVDKGVWGDIKLDGLSIVAVVRANSTLGDPYASPLPAKTVMIFDERATQAQREALVKFAQSQTSGLLNNIVGTESTRIHFQMPAAKHGSATLEAGNLVRLSTRALTGADDICHNEDVFYKPLAAHLNHAMPAYTSESTYRGTHLDINWSESGRRGSFVGTFSSPV
jgi:hypothetical protein